MDIGEGVARSFDLRLQHGGKRREVQGDLNRAREGEILPHFSSFQDGIVEHRNDERAAEALPQLRIGIHCDPVGVRGIQNYRLYRTARRLPEESDLL